MVGLIVGAALAFGFVVGLAIWATLKIAWLLLRAVVYGLTVTLGFLARRLGPAS